MGSSMRPSHFLRVSQTTDHAVPFTRLTAGFVGQHALDLSFVAIRACLRDGFGVCWRHALEGSSRTHWTMLGRGEDTRTLTADGKGTL